MKAHEAFPSPYLACAELEGQELSLVIVRLEMEEFMNEGKKVHKPVLYFQNEEKGFVVNKTNWEIIASHYGEDSDDWLGKEIILTPSTALFGGKTVPSIRVRVPLKQAPARQQFRKPETSPRAMASHPLPGDRGADEPPEWEPPR